MYVRSRQPNGEVRGILVHDNRNANAPVTMMAERGALVSTDQGPRFLLINGNRQEMQRDRRTLDILYFDRYSLDLSSFSTVGGGRWREPRERFLHELFRAPQNADDEASYNELIADGHKRLVSPLYSIVFTLIGLAATLAGEFNRRGRLPRLMVGVGAAIVFQGVAVALVNLIVKAPGLTPVVYVHVLAVAVAAAWVLFRQPRRRRQAGSSGLEPGRA